LLSVKVRSIRPSSVERRQLRLVSTYRLQVKNSEISHRRQ
jgi:hypothetical protein